MPSSDLSIESSPDRAARQPQSDPKSHNFRTLAGTAALAAIATAFAMNSCHHERDLAAQARALDLFSGNELRVMTRSAEGAGFVAFLPQLVQRRPFSNNQDPSSARIVYGTLPGADGSRADGVMILGPSLRYDCAGPFREAGLVGNYLAVVQPLGQDDFELLNLWDGSLVAKLPAANHLVTPFTAGKLHAVKFEGGVLCLDQQGFPAARLKEAYLDPVLNRPVGIGLDNSLKFIIDPKSGKPGHQQGYQTIDVLRRSSLHSVLVGSFRDSNGIEKREEIRL
ncbi:MAG: hypothetical protein K1X83_14725 [Oligoflexia bacterium]|nr:hypothetical protein [Oligoflexia bacterium]